MARKYEGTSEEWTLYVPDVWGERELFQEDPGEAITMEIRWANKRTLDRLDRARKKKAKKTGAPHSAQQQMLLELFRDHVRNIRNVDSPDDGLPVITGEDLFHRGEEILGVDVARAICDRSYLEAGMAKKLSSRCDTSASPQMSTKSGVAVDATPPSHQSSRETPAPTTPSFDGTTPRSDESGVATTRTTPTTSPGNGPPSSDDARRAS